MSLTTKYNTKRKFVRMSRNKFNVFNLFTFRRVYRTIRNQKLNLKSLIFKQKFSYKQRIKRYFGFLNESQFNKTFRLAFKLRNKKNIKKKKIYQNDIFFFLLEKRLDAAMYRIGWAPSIFSARQIITHGHVLVNNVKVTYPGYVLANKDLIQIKNSSIPFLINLNKINLNFLKIKKFIKAKKNNDIKFHIQKYYSILKSPKTVPTYCIVNYNILSAVILDVKKLNQIPYPHKLNSKLITKYYRGGIYV